MNSGPNCLLYCLGTLLLAACSDVSRLPDQADAGAKPILSAPRYESVPTINIAPAKGWPEGVMPNVATGFAVNAFAVKLDHPRWLYVLPNGDLLVAETNRPPKKPDGIKAWIMSKVQARAGAGTPSANRITLLRDADSDGVAETRSVLLEGLNSPFGMALVDDQLYVANADALVRFPYKTGQTRIESAGVKVVDLPGGPINHHWTKNIIASADGKKLYATAGSNSNVAENGLENEVNRAAVLEIDLQTQKLRLFASGLRNPNGLDWHPESGALWTVVNERDGLGSDLVPDYLTSVREGAFYGWPYSYYGHHVDTRVRPPRPDLVQKAIVPDYALGSHVAALGLAFYKANAFPERYKNGAFVGLHGSWNRKPLSGYKVAFVPFERGMPAGQMVDILTGFVNREGEAYGRPVGVVVDGRGSLLIADDVGNVIWRVSASGEKQK
jgi:glucose/arabinose dehydrogenase